MFLELNILYMIKVAKNKIFCDYFLSYLVWKTEKRNWKKKTLQTEQ